MRCVVGKIAFEKSDAMTSRHQRFEQAAQQRRVTIAPRRTDAQPKDDELHDGRTC
jgi:hypothetical protein